MIGTRIDEDLMGCLDEAHAPSQRGERAAENGGFLEAALQRTIAVPLSI
jgi:hypothetical protein